MSSSANAQNNTVDAPDALLSAIEGASIEDTAPDTYELQPAGDDSVLDTTQQQPDASTSAPTATRQPSTDPSSAPTAAQQPPTLAGADAASLPAQPSAPTSHPEDDMFEDLKRAPTPERPSTLYPSITNDIVTMLKLVRDRNAILRPVRQLEMTGTVKLHGTHADVLLWQGDQMQSLGRGEGRIQVQSRNVVNITPEKDNEGFATFVKDNEQAIRDVFSKVVRRWGTIHTDAITRNLDFQCPVLLAGEWIGRGVKEGVAISKLDHRMFVICSIQMNGMWEHLEHYKNVLPNERLISNILIAPVKQLTLKLEDEGKSFKETADQLAVEYEARCPFGEVLGVEGKGEGLVWNPSIHQITGPATVNNLPVFWLKSKGPGSSNSVPRDALTSVEGQDKLNVFVAHALTNERLEQAWDALKEGEEGKEGKQNVTGTGDFITFVLDDIAKENENTIRETGLEQAWKKSAASLAKKWFQKKLKGVDAGDGDESIKETGEGGAQDDEDAGKGDGGAEDEKDES